MDKIEKELNERSDSSCELCGNKGSLHVFAVEPIRQDVDSHILICQKCFEEINGSGLVSVNHWRCLTSSMWSVIPAVQVMSWRMLSRLQHQGEGWAQDQLEMLYLDDVILAWAKAADNNLVGDDVEKVAHRDSNGTKLNDGDTVMLIKDLDVKGAGFTAKRGTTVKSISLVEDNSTQIECKINGQQIVILTQYVKKQ